MIVYELSDGHYDYDSGCGELFVSEDAARSYLRNGKHFVNPSVADEWSEKRHPNGDLVITFRSYTPKRRLFRYEHVYYISEIEVNE